MPGLIEEAYSLIAPIETIVWSHISKLKVPKGVYKTKKDLDNGDNC